MGGANRDTLKGRDSETSLSLLHVMISDLTLQPCECDRQDSMLYQRNKKTELVDILKL
jgi:hypothetical protein